ncbi:cytochrome c biogenesis CcdA family protein [Celeribacter sp.]|uniref:cytochrome c biogenesis CcdA family protein n=1 Tax=Celeribacter sp. TaxID=1890673 RepID=UPI003A92819C
MEILLAYGAGLLTLINPCVLPVLPIILATAVQAGRFGPVTLAAGMSLSFVVFGMFVTTVGYSVGLDQDTLSRIGAWLMVAFGLVLTVPQFSAAFSTATAGFAARADARIDRLDRSDPFWGQFLGGALLGLVWSPCIGPTLGGAIALASQGESLAWATVIMVGFAAGVSTLIIGLSYGARSALQKRQAMMRALAERSRPILGVVFLAVGLMILFRVHHMIEAWAVQNLPAWLIDLSVSL